MDMGNFGKHPLVKKQTHNCYRQAIGTAFLFKDMKKKHTNLKGESSECWDWNKSSHEKSRHITDGSQSYTSPSPLQTFTSAVLRKKDRNKSYNVTKLTASILFLPLESISQGVLQQTLLYISFSSPFSSFSWTLKTKLAVFAIAPLQIRPLYINDSVMIGTSERVAVFTTRDGYLCHYCTRKLSKIINVFPF